MKQIDTRIFDLFERDEEYPKNVAERGVQNNTLYSYISNTFLDGLINYVDVFWACVIERYEVWDMQIMKETITAVSSNHHTKYSAYIDDCLLLAETDHCYWFFWYDRDVSDCMIGRMDKSIAIKADLIALTKAFVESHDAPIERGENCEGITGRWMELPNPTGWASF